MSEIERCPHCGSWDAQCISEKPHPSCRCRRCACAHIDDLERQLRHYEEGVRCPNCDMLRLEAGDVRRQLAEAQRDAEMYRSLKDNAAGLLQRLASEKIELERQLAEALKCVNAFEKAKAEYMVKLLLQYSDDATGRDKEGK